MQVSDIEIEVQSQIEDIARGDDIHAAQRLACAGEDAKAGMEHVIQAHISVYPAAQQAELATQIVEPSSPRVEDVGASTQPPEDRGIPTQAGKQRAARDIAGLTVDIEAGEVF